MRFPALFLLVCLLWLSGCSLTSSVDVREAQQYADTAEAQLVRARHTVATLQTQLAAAKELADATKNAQAIAAVKVLSDAAEAAAATVPHLEDASAKAKEALAKLKEQGDTAPLWQVLAALALAGLPKALTFVPGIGAAAEPLAKVVSNVGWALMGTRTQKEEDDLNAKKAAALYHQVSFGNALVAKLPAETVKPIKDNARAYLEEEGLHTVVKSVVRQVEREGQPS
jgi:hypothetical protein